MKAVLMSAAILATTIGATGQTVPRPAFADWIEGIRAEALGRGIRPSILEVALAGVNEPVSTILERDRTQPEIAQTLEQYVTQRVTPSVIRSGRQMVARHRPVLDRVAEAYGVPATVIVAVWGIESNFGQFSGSHPVVPALTTLAWDGRRGTFFRRELLDALEILNRGDIELDRLRGSWAGAMGQPQFMPSSYLKFAEDFDGDGRRDIWDTPADIFASVGNYLRGHDWVTGYRWGREVRIEPDVGTRILAEVAQRSGSCSAKRNMTAQLPLDAWQRLGVRLLDGSRLPIADQDAWLVSGSTRHFLVYQNYDALLAYNCAHGYAVSVALLSEYISG